VAELEEMLAACRKNKVQFMDGVMFMHSDRLPLMRRALDESGKVGQIKRIASHFSFLAAPEFMTSNIRASSDLEPLGALGDLGWYNTRFTLWAMNYQLPTHVTGRILTAGKRPDSSLDVPLEFSAELWFPGGVSASYYCSFVTQIQQWANISAPRATCISTTSSLLFGCEAAFELVVSNLDRSAAPTNMPRRRNGLPRRSTATTTHRPGNWPVPQLQPHRPHRPSRAGVGDDCPGDAKGGQRLLGNRPGMTGRRFFAVRTSIC